MKRIMGPLSIGMIMGASLTSAYFMMPKMKKKVKDIPSPYTSDKHNAKDK